MIPKDSEQRKLSYHTNYYDYGGQPECWTCSERIADGRPRTLFDGVGHAFCSRDCAEAYWEDYDDLMPGASMKTETVE